MIRTLISFTLATAVACTAQAAPQPTAPQSQPNPPAAQTPQGQANPPATPSSPQTPANAPATAPQLPPKAPPTPPAAPADTAAAVAPTQPVLTIKGLCPPTPVRKTAAAAKPAPAACKTVVSKAQFEKIMEAVTQPNQKIAPAMRRNFAQVYVELLTYSQAAQKAGVDKDPKFQEFMRLIRMKTLGDFYRRMLEEKYRTPPDSEVQAYYNQNLPKYEEIKISRIFVPAKNAADPNNSDYDKKALQESNEIHDRAAKGEDFDKLQKEAFTTLGLTIAPPNTAAGTRRRGMMTPREEQELFSLKPGEVSKLEQDPSGYTIYKVESKQTLPVTQVKDEISRELFRQKMEGQIKSVTSAMQPDFNNDYFGPPAPPTPPPSRIPPGDREGRRPLPPPNNAPPPSTVPPGAAPPPDKAPLPGAAPPSTPPPQTPPK